MHFAFGDLLADIGPWMMVGILLAGTITVFLSPGTIETYLGDGIFSMLAMLIIATPLYVCATASTPIAAALALKGLSPGAALVFLLAGPATNAATITMVSKLLGKQVAAVYLVSIILCSLLLGLAANSLYQSLGLDISSWIQTSGTETHGIFSFASAILLTVLIAKPILTKRFSRKKNPQRSVDNKHLLN